MAAATVLGQRDVARAGRLFRTAAGLAAALPAQDPGHRALAVAANNLATELCEQNELSGEVTALMLMAAEAGRHHWQIAGTWLNVARAEYRLSVCRRKAGDAAGAAVHALSCLAVLGEHPEAEAWDQFHGWQALAAAERAAGKEAEFLRARENAENAFGQLSAEDQPYCRTALESLK